MKRLLVLPAMSALIWLQALRAEEPKPAAIRSIVTSPAGLTDAGTLELELGGSHAFAKDGTRKGGITGQFNLGLISWLDLRFGWTPHTWNRDGEGQSNRGFGDPFIGGQVLFAGQDKVGADIGLIFNHLLPRADVSKGLSSGYHEDTLMVAISRSAGRWAVDMNAGILRSRIEDGSRKANQKAGSLAITCTPAQGWSLSLDTYGKVKSDLGDRELSSILGASHDISDRLTLDVSVEHGWAEASPRFTANAGLVYRFGRLWGRK